jgi:cytochrome c oxidase subunit III
MSVDVAHGHHGHGAHEAHEPHLAHQFEDRAQQDESYIVGMWTFLVTEIMFFGALFLAYTTYRWLNPTVFIEAHKHLNVAMGTTNTVILLTSSLFMALAVYNAQKENKAGQLFWLFLTILCAFGFLIIKYFEYSEKIEHHLVPGPTFQYKDPGSHGESSNVAHAAPPAGSGAAEHASASTQTKIPPHKAEMFFCLYFIMTGLHGIHVVIGILVMGILWVMIKFNSLTTKYYMWVEMTGLYWHFVDIVWIFLFPLYYLIPGS